MINSIIDGFVLITAGINFVGWSFGMCKFGALSVAMMGLVSCCILKVFLLQRDTNYDYLVFIFATRGYNNSTVYIVCALSCETCAIFH